MSDLSDHLWPLCCFGLVCSSVWPWIRPAVILWLQLVWRSRCVFLAPVQPFWIIWTDSGRKAGCVTCPSRCKAECSGPTAVCSPHPRLTFTTRWAGLHSRAKYTQTLWHRDSWHSWLCPASFKQTFSAMVTEKSPHWRKSSTSGNVWHQRTLESQFAPNNVLKGNSGIFKPMKYVHLLTENSLVKVGVLRKIFRFLQIHITEWTGLRRCSL